MGAGRSNFWRFSTGAGNTQIFEVDKVFHWRKGSKILRFCTGAATVVQIFGGFALAQDGPALICLVAYISDGLCCTAPPPVSAHLLGWLVSAYLLGWLVSAYLLWNHNTG